MVFHKWHTIYTRCPLITPTQAIYTAIERLKKANELIAKKHGSDIVFQQNLKDIHTFNSYLEKIDSNNRYTNQGEVI